MTTIYELVDVSDDEMFYPLGWWPDPEQAKQAVEAFLERNGIPPAGPITDGDYITLELRMRAMGWSADGSRVWRATWGVVEDSGSDDHPYGIWELKEQQTLAI